VRRISRRRARRSTGGITIRRHALPYYVQDGVTLYHGNVLEVLPSMAAESVQCCMTSPPYW